MENAGDYYMNRIKTGLALLLSAFTLWVCGCGASFDDTAEELGLVFDNPGDGGRPSPSFQNDILPILLQRCAYSGCHDADGPHDVDLRSFESIQQGGHHSALVVPGSARASDIVSVLVTGTMPHEGPPLDPAQIQLIIDWINEGAENN